MKLALCLVWILVLTACAGTRFPPRHERTPQPEESQTRSSFSASPATGLQSPAPSGANPQQALMLQRRIEALEERVQRLEMRGVPTATWSCKSRCGRLVGVELGPEMQVTATGTSAAAAYDALIARCPNSLFKEVRRTSDGNVKRAELVPPTINEACTRN